MRSCLLSGPAPCRSWRTRVAEAIGRRRDRRANFVCWTCHLRPERCIKHVGGSTEGARSRRISLEYMVKKANDASKPRPGKQRSWAASFLSCSRSELFSVLWQRIKSRTADAAYSSAPPGFSPMLPCGNGGCIEGRFVSHHPGTAAPDFSTHGHLRMPDLW